MESCWIAEVLCFPTKIHVVVDVQFSLACLDQVRNLLTKLRADKKKQVRVRRVCFFLLQTTVHLFNVQPYVIDSYYS